MGRCPKPHLGTFCKKVPKNLKKTLIQKRKVFFAMKVFSQVFYKKLVGYGVKPHGFDLFLQPEGQQMLSFFIWVRGGSNINKM